MSATESKRKTAKADSVSTRSRIKAIARELFIRYGLNDVTYGDIVERAGMTRANLHYHFGNKADLVTEVFRDTSEAVDAKNRDIWLNPELTLDQRIERALDDARKRFYEFDEDGKGRNPWSLSSRARFENTLLSDDSKSGIATMSRKFEDYVDHAVRLAIGSGELRPDAPVRSVRLLIAPLWYFGSPMTQHGGFRKLEEHYQAVRRVIRDAYGRSRISRPRGRKRPPTRSAEIKSRERAGYIRGAAVSCRRNSTAGGEEGCLHATPLRRPASRRRSRHRSGNRRRSSIPRLRSTDGDRRGRWTPALVPAPAVPTHRVTGG